MLVVLNTTVQEIATSGFKYTSSGLKIVRISHVSSTTENMIAYIHTKPINKTAFYHLSKKVLFLWILTDASFQGTESPENPPEPITHNDNSE